MYLLFLLIGILLFLMLNKKNKFCISVQESDQGGDSSDSGGDDGPNIAASVGQSGYTDIIGGLPGVTARLAELTPRGAALFSVNNAICAVAGMGFAGGLGVLARNQLRGNNRYDNLPAAVVDVENQDGP